MSLLGSTQRARYCKGAAMNWHAADSNGRMYRCGCMRSFRLPGGKTGPNAAILKRKGAREMKRKTRWDIPTHIAKVMP